MSFRYVWLLEPWDHGHCGASAQGEPHVARGPCGRLESRAGAEAGLPTEPHVTRHKEI